MRRLARRVRARWRKPEADCTYTITLHREAGSWWSEIREVPGCYAAGGTLPEWAVCLAEALAMTLPEGWPVSAPDAACRLCGGDVPAGADLCATDQAEFAAHGHPPTRTEHPMKIALSLATLASVGTCVAVYSNTGNIPNWLALTTLILAAATITTNLRRT